MIITDIEQKIINQLSLIVKNNFETEIEVELEKPKDIKNGTFSTNTAMKLTKQLKKNPREIATLITEQFECDEYIEKVEIAGPGFINFFTTTKYLNDIVATIDENYGQHPKLNNGKYLVEYVSANPTGDLHLGHARGGAYGDALIRIMKKAGYDVTSEYYINDAGSQMNNLGLSVQYFYLEKFTTVGEFPEDGYRGQDIKDIAAQLFAEFGETKKDEPVEFFTEYGYARNLAEIKKILADVNITFDSWFSERELYKNNEVADALNTLNASGDLYEEDGAMWLRTSKYFDEKDRAIQKSDGSFTYLAADVAYHLNKYNRGFDHLIDIWGADHHGYVARVRSSIQSLGQQPEAFEVPLIQMVSILNNNEKVKMSKRAGTSVTIKDLLKEIDSEALRYFFVMRSPDTQLDFDIKVASEQSMDNPMYYIQYANARISSVLNDCVKKEITPGAQLTSISELETEIISHLSIYPKVISEAANKRLPHIMCNYLYDLAALFHRYYNQERVFTEDPSVAQNKMLMYTAIKHVLVSGLDVIGIVAKDEM
ncbi:arginine--tRNA ligase [Mollicutes bacterium LVI A0039]|nr:arginine--tRNA ligase [Mollicutes bacterium LVI A0039]